MTNRTICRSHLLKGRGVKTLPLLNGKRTVNKMPKYTYKFCNGDVSEVEVSEEQFAQLTAMDKEERQNNLRQKRRNTSLASYQRKEEKHDNMRDKDFKGENE